MGNNEESRSKIGSRGDEMIMTRDIKTPPGCGHKIESVKNKSARFILAVSCPPRGFIEALGIRKRSQQTRL